MAGLMGLGAHAAQLPEFPARPIRIVTAEIGGGNDFAARIIAQGVAPALGKPVIVENRGGSVVVAAQIVGTAQPDGHTLLLIVRVLTMADVEEKFNRAGVEPVGSTPAQLATTMKSDMARIGKVIKAAGIRSE